MDKIKRIILDTIGWILDHKKIVFVYIPLALSVLFFIYVVHVYFSWQNDRDKSLEKLAKYKMLIDRTEDLKKGNSYNYSDVDLTAKVVDIPTRIYDRNNEIIGEFFEQKREIVPYDFIPEWIIKSVIASEDRDFYKHRGISSRGILRAFFMNVLHLGVVQGGSTITQQLAKVLFTDMERSIKRKIYETFCAMDIEKKYDKQDILSMYLNLIYFGNGAYGVESAAKMFFGTSVRDLNDVECAMIVATISSPKTYSPIFNLNNSVRKTKRVLQSLSDAGFITEKKAEYNYKKFLKKWDVVFDKNGNASSSIIGSFIYSSYRVNRSPFFNESVRKLLVDKFGEDVVKRGGLSVYTTIDAEKQDIALAALKKGVKAQRTYHINLSKRAKTDKISSSEKEKSENIEGALISLNPLTGEIIAYVGGSEFSSANQQDCVSQIYRQPGSSFKPVVYAAAVESRDITPSTIFDDRRITFKGGYSPQNYDAKYTGKMPARLALSKSVNVIAVQILDKTGYDKIFEVLKKGLSLTGGDLEKRFGKTLSMALGAYEMSPLENCTLHSIIANGGIFIIPYGIRLVKDYNEKIVWNYEEEILKKTEDGRKDLGMIMDPAATAVTVSMMKGVFEKNGTAHFVPKSYKIRFPIAGKTGTSSNYSDAWFLGYTSNLVTAVWIGNKKGSISLGAGRSGSSLATPVWAEFISAIYRDNPPGDFRVPSSGLTKETICTESGRVADKNGGCPETAEQYYFSGTEPGEYCDLHKKKEEDSTDSVTDEKKNTD
ncbi:MAG: transglycosylase domain-containing protein [Spirochaetes bacterium]|jgi:penicillin-binding protein 1A|nr:transglycosylase domain-containing protein [Spirochaetota bacterium]